MKIVDRTRNKTKKLKNLELEDVFRWDGRLFMKVSSCYDDGCVNAYDFSRRRLTDLVQDAEVEVIPTELILHEKGWDG